MTLGANSVRIMQITVFSIISEYIDKLKLQLLEYYDAVNKFLKFIISSRSAVTHMYVQHK